MDHKQQNTKEKTILHEITPLQDQDTLYIADRCKAAFSYPIHNHMAYELNFVEHAAGVRRIVGDHTEVIGDFDLVLITSPELEHVWEQNTCRSENIREITIQFNWDMSDGFLSQRPFESIRTMMERAKKGLAFPVEAIMQIYTSLTNLSKIQDSFQAALSFLTILHQLSLIEGAHTLATNSYAKVDIHDDSERILKVKNFIHDHYMDEVRLDEMASIAGMSRSAFSRFFKLHTGQTLRDYLIDIRLGNAARLLVDTNESISNISFFCGFNNLSNFNRIFKDRKNVSPSEFREQVKKVRIEL